jgi:hypothetical protein
MTLEKEKEYQKAYREANKEKAKDYNIKYRQENETILKDKSKTCYLNNKEHVKKTATNYYHDNKEKILANQKIHRDNNKEKFKIRKKIYRTNNKKSLAKKDKAYAIKNKERILVRKRIYGKNRRLTNPLFKLKCNIRRTIAHALTKNGYTKKSRTYELLGCSYENFLIHIESQWPLQKNLDENGQVWMNWSNCGNPKDGIFELNKTWDIDHIVSLASAKTEEELFKLFHYTNQQPLCSYVNRWVKRNRTDY